MGGEVRAMSWQGLADRFDDMVSMYDHWVWFLCEYDSMKKEVENCKIYALR
jgi:hypothetical protein